MNRTNKTYSKKLAEVFESHKRELQLEILPEEIAEDLILDVFVSSIINSMQNIPLADVTGNEKDKGIADDTIENRKAVMKNLPDLYDELQVRAKSIVSFRGSNAKN
jgi:DNA-directed RNA polymerase specialized sigma subunit